MAQKTGLGRGLGALIPGGDNVQMGNGVILIPVDKVLPNPRQPRNMMHPESLEELTQSVREHGVLQPLIVTLGESDDLYILIAGERRLEAARVGKSRVAVTNTLRLLRLPDSVKNALIENRISEGHARSLLALSTPEAQ